MVAEADDGRRVNCELGEEVGMTTDDSVGPKVPISDNSVGKKEGANVGDVDGGNNGAKDGAAVAKTDVLEVGD